MVSGPKRGHKPTGSPLPDRRSAAGGAKQEDIGRAIFSPKPGRRPSRKSGQNSTTRKQPGKQQRTRVNQGKQAGRQPYYPKKSGLMLVGETIINRDVICKLKTLVRLLV